MSLQSDSVLWRIPKTWIHSLHSCCNLAPQLVSWGAALQAGQPVLRLLTSSWHGSCRQMAPILSNFEFSALVRQPYVTLACVASVFHAANCDCFLRHWLQNVPHLQKWVSFFYFFIFATCFHMEAWFVHFIPKLKSLYDRDPRLGVGLLFKKMQWPTASWFSWMSPGNRWTTHTDPILRHAKWSRIHPKEQHFLLAAAVFPDIVFVRASCIQQRVVHTGYTVRNEGQASQIVTQLSFKL